jgi:hypothetical protein
LFGQLRA